MSKLKIKIISGLLFAIGVIILFFVDSPATTISEISSIEYISYIFMLLGICFLPLLALYHKLFKK